MITRDKLYSGAETLATKIRAYNTRIKSAETEAHRLACSVLAHVVDHADTRPLSAFTRVVGGYNDKTGKFDGRITRGADFRGWVEKHSNLSWGKKGWTKGKAPEFVIDLDAAMKEAFWHAKEAKSPDYKDPVQVLSGYVAAMSKDGRFKPEHEAMAGVAIGAMKKALEGMKEAA